MKKISKVAYYSDKIQLCLDVFDDIAAIAICLTVVITVSAIYAGELVRPSR